MKLVTPKEYALLRGVPEQTARRWCVNGGIKAVRIGKRWRIPVEDEAPKQDTSEQTKQALAIMAEGMQLMLDGIRRLEQHHVND